MKHRDETIRILHVWVFLFMDSGEAHMPYSLNYIYEYFCIAILFFIHLIYLLLYGIFYKSFLTFYNVTKWNIYYVYQHLLTLLVISGIPDLIITLFWKFKYLKSQRETMKGHEAGASFFTLFIFFFLRFFLFSLLLWEIMKEMIHPSFLF